MSIPIRGICLADIEGTDATAKSGGSWFPATTTGYTRFTGLITAAEVKSINDDEFLAFTVVNGSCKQEILISLEPSKLNPQFTGDTEKQIQSNLDNLKKALKLSGCYNTNGHVEVKNLKPNRILAFDAKITKWREYNGAKYPQIRAYFKGEASALVAVTPLDLEAARAAAGQGAPSASMLDSEIPF